ncbi:MAG TPA: hypothetical protein VJ725_00550 [Thermoanaerobaculia bacterium]|nr:hypothetical protein [Thermoanaerobaculia bacterium]
MSRKTASRGISALIFVLALTLAGASPAAAADLGLWDFSFDHLVSGFWGEVTGWLSGADKRGFGIDPNGKPFSAQTDPGPPAQANPQGQPFSPSDHP